MVCQYFLESFKNDKWEPIEAEKNSVSIYLSTMCLLGYRTNIKPSRVFSNEIPNDLGVVPLIHPTVCNDIHPLTVKKIGSFYEEVYVYSLFDILNIDWKNTYSIGYVTVNEFSKLNNYNYEPDNYRTLNVLDYKVISNEEMAKVIKCSSLSDGNLKYYTTVTWKDYSLASRAGNFREEMLKIKKYENTNKIRILFDFKGRF